MWLLQSALHFFGLTIFLSYCSRYSGNPLCCHQIHCNGNCTEKADLPINRWCFRICSTFVKTLIIHIVCVVHCMWCRLNKNIRRPRVQLVSVAAVSLVSALTFDIHTNVHTQYNDRICSWLALPTCSRSIGNATATASLAAAAVVVRIAATLLTNDKTL